MAPSTDVDWERLDKRKFFFVGVGLFSGVTTALFPLSVVKTQQMAAHGGVAPGLSGSRQVARHIWRHEGIRGFYRGYGTVLFGTIPGRTIYITSLEVAKSATARLGQQLDVSPTALAGASSFVGGAAASLSTQVVVVPVDVVSQRLMVQGAAERGAAAAAAAAAAGQAGGAGAAPGRQQQQQQRLQQQPGSSSRLTPAGSGGVPLQQPQPMAAAPASSGAQPQRRFSSSSGRQRLRWAPTHLPQPQQPQPRAGLATAAAGVQRMNGLQMVRLIVAQEGVGGLYRGFWPSVCTFIPSNAVWWGANGLWQHAIWDRLPASVTRPPSGEAPSTSAVVGVQVAAGVLAGCTSALLTNPLDLVKTRLQVAEAANGAPPSWAGVLRELLAEEGARGLLRGVAPRMASSAMWGTAMVTTYEFLKRICAAP